MRCTTRLSPHSPWGSLQNCTTQEVDKSTTFVLSLSRTNKFEGCWRRGLTSQRDALLVFPRTRRGAPCKTALRKKLINQPLLFSYHYAPQTSLRVAVLKKQKDADCSTSSCFVSFCGKRGIRTPETLLGFTRFPGGPVQPLLHLSLCDCKDSTFCQILQLAQTIIIFLRSILISLLYRVAS